MTLSTSDPVTVEVIAERLGMAYATVSSWRHRGVLPEPDWVRGSTPIWAWEKLSKHEALRPILEGFSVPLGRLPQQGLVMGPVYGKRPWEVVQRRWDRHGKGYVSVPMVDQEGERYRLVVAEGESEGLEPVDSVTAKTTLVTALRKAGQLRLDADWRKPIVSDLWAASGG